MPWSLASRSVSWHFISWRHTTSGCCVASQRNTPLLAAERTPLTLRVITRMLLSRLKAGDAAVRGRPFGRLVQELLELRNLRGLQIAALLHHRQHIPPSRQAVQPHAEVGERFLRLWKDVVIKVDEHVLDDGARLAQRAYEIDLRAAVGREVFHQERAGAFADIAFDLCIAAEALGLLAYILHRQPQAIGDPGRVGDAGRLATGHDVELFEPHVAGARGRGEVDQLAADAWIRDELADVDVDRDRPAGGEDEGLFVENQHGLDPE